MEFTIFYAWQSDRPSGANRSFIEQAAKKAITELQAQAEFEDSPRPALDKDTQGVPGTPAIADSILQKIDECGVFLADVTYVATGDAATQRDAKRLPNPNVLLELGYAIALVSRTARARPAADQVEAERAVVARANEARRSFEERVAAGQFNGLVCDGGVVALSLIPAKDHALPFRNLPEEMLPNTAGMLNSHLFEQQIIAPVCGWLGVLRDLGLVGRLYFGMTLFGVKDFAFYRNSWALKFQHPGAVRLHPEDRIVVDSVAIDNTDALDDLHAVAQALRPAFDAIWQEFGHNGSLNYDDAGNFIGRFL